MTSQSQQTSHLDALLKLYKPNVKHGNYQADIAWRGENRMLVKVAVVLGMATEDEMEARFKALDEAASQRSDAVIAGIEDREHQNWLARRKLAASIPSAPAKTGNEPS